ncbi:hypothetical protein HETIRDRAFT_448436 [Heterobasidion irregulare TC 32-1]|uniref:Uncharacterized protein n=1 Tax=Heterobasidion irregulare (strain TC 32-1) TaxID=747525 RepID=W4KHY3_HETIT|nr:uncharacterized protein HETIRDRAFT_448436 [Heterobasidion irregulare TC 32-1]ETW85289.1 hypothetical protein HETIRDRAFT_448436 [Heterobasidion irregulare TC 32-1]
MGRPTPRANPHSGELERHVDMLLQQNTISMGNPEMKIVTYLDYWLLPGMNTMMDDYELSSSTPMSSPSILTKSSFQLSSSPGNWGMSNQAEPTLSALSLGTYHIPENVPHLYQIQEGLRTWL